MLLSSTPASNLVMWLGSLWPTLLMPADKVDLTYPLMEKYAYLLQETGYLHIQATKPDTVGMIFSYSAHFTVPFHCSNYRCGTE